MSQGERKSEESRDKLEELLRQSHHLAQPAKSSASDRAALPSRLLERLLSISRTMNGLTRREELFTYLRDRLSELFDAENSQVILFGRDGAPRVMGGSEGSREAELSHTLMARVRARKRPLMVRDISQDEDLRDRSSVRRMGLSSVLCAPLVVDNEVIGVIQFDHRDRPGPFTNEDLALLSMLSQQASTALRNVMLVERLEKANDRMRAAKERMVANDRMRALGEMAAAVAHDFNNLLSSIIGLSDLMLESGRLRGSLCEDMKSLRIAAFTGSDIVRRLRQFAGRAQTADKPKELDVCDIVREMAAMIRHRFLDTSPHRLVLECVDVPPVRGGKSELREALLNLILNGLEAMPGGGVLTLRTLVREERVVIEIEDSGVGIDPKAKDRIFDPFYSTKESGHGLGLSICWSIIQRMGGEIGFKETVGGGSTAFVSLPRASGKRGDDRDRGAAVRAAEQLPASPRGGPVRLLIVDNDVQLLGLLCRMVEGSGYTVLTAGDGMEALDLMARESLDLVLTDLTMPGMTGVQLARELRARGHTCPVVLLTGWGEESAVEEDEISAVLYKPINRKKLVDMIEHVLAVQ